MGTCDCRLTVRVNSVADAEALLVPWVDPYWFFSFNLKAVQAVYGVEEEVAV